MGIPRLYEWSKLIKQRIQSDWDNIKWPENRMGKTKVKLPTLKGNRNNKILWKNKFLANSQMYEFNAVSENSANLPKKIKYVLDIFSKYSHKYDKNWDEAIKPPNHSYLPKTLLAKISPMWKILSPCGSSMAEATKQGGQKSNACNEHKSNK